MPNRDLIPYLGQAVQVVVDRPLGSVHPRHPDSYYTVNYGFLPGTISGDGAPIDAYVLGVDTPVERYQGMVIAVVEREDDVEDKLVVALRGTSFSREEIAKAVAFQEQFFSSKIVTAPSYAEIPHAPSHRH
jgi:inorganic pyrophosphatase